MGAKRDQRIDIALQPASPSYVGEAEYEPDDRHDLAIEGRKSADQ